MSRRAITSVLGRRRHREIWHRRKYDTEARGYPADFENGQSLVFLPQTSKKKKEKERKKRKGTKEPRNARNAALGAGKAKKWISPRAWAVAGEQHFDFDSVKLILDFDLQNCKRINVYCLKTPSLW